ncbi:MAG: response regulator [Alphaproteobacteria bacterium]
MDDDEEFRTIVRRVAEPLGWRISEFSNGMGLIAAIGGSLRPDLIVLGMVMPELDGIETIGGIGATSVRCPVVLITGRLPLYTTAARELGQANSIEIVDVLQKPVSLARLRAILNPGSGENGTPGPQPPDAN